MCFSLSLFLAMAHVAAVQPDFVTMFQPMEYRYTGGGYKDKVFRYRLFLPESSNPEKRFPLIVWLHGRGERGTDNVYQLQWLDELMMPPPWQAENFSFGVLAVQCPKGNSYWTRNGREPEAPDDMINVVEAILKETLKTQSVDPDRVYLSGVSSGGTGCWRMAMRYPKYFAAVAPLGSRGTSDKRLRGLVNTPTWVFHSERDKAISIKSAREGIEQLRRLGGKAWLTSIDSDQHDCWTSAFKDYHVLDWMLAQRRGGPIWQWWQMGLQLSVLVAIAGTGWSVVRFRERISASARLIKRLRTRKEQT